MSVVNVVVATDSPALPSGARRVICWPLAELTTAIAARRQANVALERRLAPARDPVSELLDCKEDILSPLLVHVRARRNTYGSATLVARTVPGWNRRATDQTAIAARLGAEGVRERCNETVARGRSTKSVRPKQAPIELAPWLAAVEPRRRMMPSHCS